MSKLLPATFLLACLTACAATPDPLAPGGAVAEPPLAAAAPAAPLEAQAPTPSPSARLLTELEQAFAEHREILRGEFEGAALLAEAKRAGLADEAKLSGWLEQLYADCLELREEYADACVKRDQSPAPERKKLLRHAEPLMDMLAELADASPRPSELPPGLRLLLALSARNVSAAEGAVERFLERRAEALVGQRACVPPSEAEIAEAKRELADFHVVDVAGGGRLRKPSPSEMSDLAYLYAASRGSGPALMSAVEDRLAPPVPATDPAAQARVELREAMKVAHFDGDPAAHLGASLAYLATLGFPGPIREKEEDDERWGGKGYAYVMRQASYSAELVGDLELASALARRANPGGGMCGTSFPYMRDEQLRRVIRVDEQRRGCRAALPERLFGVASEHELYGPAPLARAGFDLERLYRGALVTLGRRDAEALQKALASNPAALARHARLGDEDWASRTRALRGYADVAGRKAAPRLFALARAKDSLLAVEALDALSELGEDLGYDACEPEERFGGRWSSQQPRPVRALDKDCKTKLSPAERKRWVGEVGSFLQHPDRDRRVAAAEALGRLGSADARRLLTEVAMKRAKLEPDYCERGTEGCSPSWGLYDSTERALEEIERIARIREDDALAKRQRAELERERASGAASGAEDPEPAADPDEALALD